MNYSRRLWLRANPFFCITVTALLLATAAIPAMAADPAPDDSWQFGAEVYLWGASIGGNSASGSDINIDFDTLLDNLEMAFMGAFAARKDKWTFITDVIYLDVDDSNDKGVTVPGESGDTITVSSDVKLKGWIVTPAALYNLVDSDTAYLNVLAGARYLWLDAGLSLDIEEPSKAIGNEFSDSGSVWDAIVGVKGQFYLAPKWYLTYHADVGTGDTDLTWQAFAGVGYRFKKFDALLVYRYLDWNFDDSSAFEDLTLSGPFMGMKFRF